jgi:hypothetical protein
MFRCWGVDELREGWRLGLFEMRILWTEWRHGRQRRNGKTVGYPKGWHHGFSDSREAEDTYRHRCICEQGEKAWQESGNGAWYWK